jgi:2-oxoglutarate ferredoxin oxidoreductase subunit gamma
MSKSEVKIAGFGGQGVVLSGSIVGKAAAIHDGKHATMTRSFGPEARGGACSAQIIIDNDKIAYPYVIAPDVLVLMSQEAYERYAKEVKPGGLLLIEQDLVKLSPEDNEKAFGIPATRLAEELGRKIVLNMVMLGFLTSISGIISPDAMRSAIKESVPKGTEELNIRAFNKGYEYGKEVKRPS